MKIKCLKLTLCLIWSITANAQSAIEISKSTHDGRMNTECNGAKKFCMLSFYQLFASTKYYDNKNISLKGYIVLDEGTLSLHPSEYSYQIFDRSSSVTFYIPASEQYSIAKKYAFSHVQIVGHFNGNDEGADHSRLGVMDKIISIFSVEMRAAVGKKEIPTVRLEDLDEAVKH